VFRTKENDMARKVEVSLIDDMDGTVASETVKFGIDGLHYEVDLSDEHAEELRALLAQYIKAGRRATPFSAEDASEIRSWAQKKGFSVSDRGRLNQDIITAYRKAHGSR
jgi:hypothetical protein